MMPPYMRKQEKSTIPSSSLQFFFSLLSVLHHFCCGATEGSEQQHNQDLKEIYKGATNSRIHHFLPQCIAFNQSALRHKQLK